MRRLFTGLLSLALSLVFMTMAIPAHATLADAQWVCTHQSTHTAAQIAWAETLVPGCVVTPTPAPAPTPVPPAPPGGMKVTSSTGLLTGLMNAKGGETFLLAPGGYSLKLSGKSFATPVTITSADPANRVQINYMKLASVAGITFRKIDFARGAVPAGTDVNSQTIAMGVGSSNLSFDQVYVHGSLDGNARNDAVGMIFNGGSNIAVTNSRFQQLGRAAQFFGISAVTVAKNDVREIRSDGFDFSAVSNALIDGNFFTNFQRVATDHPDAVQFQTAGSSRSSADIVIRNNVLLPGSGNGTQGIFMRDEVGTLPYKRVTIANNLLVGNGMENGITISNGADITITGNSVLSPIDGDVFWIRLGPIAGKKLVSGNIAMRGGQKTPTDLFNAAQLSQLTLVNVAKISAAALVVPAWGYQPVQ